MEREQLESQHEQVEPIGGTSEAEIQEPWFDSSILISLEPLPF